MPGTWTVDTLPGWELVITGVAPTRDGRLVDIRQLQVGAGNNWCSPYKGWQVSHSSMERASKKNVLKVWSTLSFKALKNVNFLTSSKYLVEHLGRKLSLKF